MHNILTIKSVSLSKPTCFDVFTSSSGNLLLYRLSYNINKINKFKIFTQVIVTDSQ